MMGFDYGSELATIKLSEDLIERCLEIGISVARYEDKETLEIFLGSNDDDYSDNEEDDLDVFDEEPSEDDEIFDEDFDFDEDDDDDEFFEDDDVS